MRDETGVVTRFFVIGAFVAKNVMGRKFAHQMEKILHVGLSRLPNEISTGPFSALRACSLPSSANLPSPVTSATISLVFPTSLSLTLLMTHRQGAFTPF